MSDQEQDNKHREISGYERMLDHLRHTLADWRDESGPRVRQALASARERVVELGELTGEEADRIAEWLQRDLEEAADYTARTERDLSDWLRMDLTLIESWLWDRFSAVADRTRLEWLELDEALSSPNSYHTGEIAGPGSLTCSACGETLQFRHAGHIPPCPSCRGSEFTRATTADEN